MSAEQPNGLSEPAFPLEELSWKITKNASVLSQYLGANNLPQPSLDGDGPSTVVPKDAPQHIRQSQQHLISASLELLQLAVGPSEYLPNLALGVTMTRLYFITYKHDELMFKSFNTSPVSPGSASTTFSVSCPLAELSAMAILQQQRMFPSNASRASCAWL